MVGDLLRRVGLAGGEEAFAVDLGPVGDPGPGAGGQEDGVGLELLDAVGGLGDDLAGALQPARPLDHADALGTEQVADRVVQPLLDAGDAGPKGVEVEPALGGQAHHLGPVQLRQEPAGGDHGLRRHAVPQVGGAADEVALDEGDLGPEPGADGGGGVPARAPADDDEPDAHIGKG